MEKIFETKKLQMETLGEYLKSIRNQLGMSVQEAAGKAKIPHKHLSALEAGLFSQLPPEVYTRGLLARLANLYNLDTDILVCQYKKENKILSLQQTQNTKLPGTIQKLYSNIVITPKFISLLGALIFIVLSVAYISWQILGVSKSPFLEITQPLNNSVIEGATVLLVGKTEPGVALRLNDQTLYVDSQGNFQAQLGNFEGTKEFTVSATNRFEKTTVKILRLTGAKQDAEQPKIQLKIEFSAAVDTSFQVDGQPRLEQKFNSGEIKTLSANERILLSTSNAGATFLTINNKPLGAMGREGEQLTDVPFFPESANMENIGQ